MRAVVAGAGDRVDGEVAQAAMDAWAAKRLRTFEDAERGLCFGRLDFEETLRRSTSAAAGCTTRSAASSSSTGRRRRHGRSTRRPRTIRTA